MKQRGRRSQASLTVVPFKAAPVQLLPPPGLDKAQRDLFAQLAAGHAHLTPGDAPMLALFVQAVTKANALAKKNDVDSVKSWDKASRNAAMWATKLRLTVQSQVLPDAAGRKRMNNSNTGLTVMQKFLQDQSE